MDSDGDYESVLQRKNSTDDWAEIPMEKGLEGKINFLGLAENAIDPLNIPVSKTGIFENPTTLDYIDINKDGKLESITYIGHNKDNFQKIKVELVNGKYILTNL